MRISVLMSVYDKENPQYLERALKSLADQTLRPEELVLVEDGRIRREHGDTIERLRKDLNIRAVRLKKNSGLAAALNAGLENCTHRLVARMDSDDICLPTRLEKQAEQFAGDKDLDVLGSFAVDIDKNENRGMLRRKPAVHEDIVRSLWSNPFIHSTVMFKKDRVLAAGGYDTSLKRRQDYELWFRLASCGLKFANIPEPLVLYRFSHETHRKQPVKLAWQQARIGYSGACLLEMAWWKKAACFEPFLRSLLPGPMQHMVYKGLRMIDPLYRKCTCQ